MEARRQTISWSSFELQEAGDVAKSRERQDGGNDSERRRKQTVDDMHALVGETEELEARVRTRSRRMKGPSASPDQPPVTEPVQSGERERDRDREESDPAGARARNATLGPPSRERTPDSSPSSGRTLPSLPPSSRKGDSGRYSFVYPPRKPKKKP